MAKKKPLICSLRTPFESGGGEGFEAYPRPQMKRGGYISLCGEWELYSLASDKERYMGKIKVPFPPESRLSGIERTKERGEEYIYRKKIILTKEYISKRVLLHFGAADQTARVFVNGKKAGEHVGGYLPFSFEIAKYLFEGENLIEVYIKDELDLDIPYGKQREKRGGMWYTPVCGLWQAVWMEAIPKGYVKSIRLTPTLDSVTIEIDGGEGEKHLSVSTPEGALEHTFAGDRFTLKLESPRLWTPEDPYLYDFTLTAGEDRIESYFALRTVTVSEMGGKSYICLNGKPYFFHGLLDQGYFPDGIYTPATPEGYKWDILKMKELGFNMLRKHIKIEPELFYYYCDKYGMIVFQDMVNSGRYHYIVDTVIPTIGPRRGITHKASPRRREIFERGAKETVACLYNHPSVCYYTVFNEGWGQYDADGVYASLKAEDPSRVWDATSGWFFERESDVRSDHIYFKKIKLRAFKDKPLVLSEFGGYSLRVEGHVFNLSENYGYKSFKDKESLTAGLSRLYLEEIVPEIEKNGLCAAVLTQLSDVEDETNGMVTYDRQVVKVDEGEMQRIANALKRAFSEQVREI